MRSRRSAAGALAPLALWALVACSDEGQSLGAVDLSDLPVDERVEAVLAEMTLQEKVGQKHGLGMAPVDDLYPTASIERLDVPGFRMVDGPRGVRAGNATAFPVGMARGASWDVDLERRVGEAMGLEAAAKGANVLLAPTMNVLRHPGWGRAQETYGEDPRHIGTMAVAFIAGVQRHVIASAKHFALNSIEDTRFDVDVSVDERTLREIYLPHFRMAVEAGVGSVMSAYNLVNGHYCAENAHLLSDILRDEWRFRGFVESDWILGTRSTVPSALAGLDIEMPAAVFFGDALLQAVEEGALPLETIDDSLRHILRAQFAFDLDDPEPLDEAVVESAEHRALAREAAAESIVLLKNESGALPLERGAITEIVVLGPLADLENLGDLGSSAVTPSEAVTALAGIEAAAGPVAVTPIVSTTLTPADEAIVAAADAAVVVVGLTHADEGENMPGAGGDRDDLALPGDQGALLSAVAALNPRTVVVLEGGSAITMQGWIDEVEAVMMAWYPGMEGGHAIAAILFGDLSPSGKLPISFPRDEADLPPFVHDQEAVSYGYFHGYRHLDREGVEPLFAFGHGLSYTRFAYADMAIGPPEVDRDGRLMVSFLVENVGDRAGAEVAQLYWGKPDSAWQRARRLLGGFARVELEPGDRRVVSIPVAVADLAIWDETISGWRVEPGSYLVEVGPSSRELPISGTFTVR